MDIDPSNLIYYGSLTTTRLEYNHKGFIYVLDDSHYNNHSDYELEIEAPSYDVGLTTFNQLLTTLSITRRKTPNKIERFSLVCHNPFSNQIICSFTASLLQYSHYN